MYLYRGNLNDGFFLIFRMASKKNIKPNEETFDDFLIRIGERLKKQRQSNGFNSYEQFAFEHNIGRAQYGKYEKGTEDLRLSSLYKVLQALDISWEDFFKGL
ncbi:helix-turn-helix transcriptional regulator [Chitinophagaceae bacterium 26-R-25]|nr:helix-turn-helix transcriptional regulator [Chitinophagaceae bacterium 26-R-25]